MRRFWVTARICRPKAERFSSISSATKTAIEKTMIHRRFQVIDRPPSAKAPDIQLGLRDLAVGRAEDGTHRLLQDQRDAPGGQQRFERPAIEVADDDALDDQADEAGEEEGAGTAKASE